jgi:hypothetical protein
MEDHRQGKEMALPGVVSLKVLQGFAFPFYM